MTAAHRSRSIAVLAAGLIAAACGRKAQPSLAAICAGARAEARVVATVDHVRGPGGPALTSLQGTRFELRFTFLAPAPGSPGGDAAATCAHDRGTATFTGEIPDPVRNATSREGTASWELQGDSVLLDLNPRVRDSNVFVTFRLDGGRGHWGLSTFAGEIAGGAVERAPQR